MLQVLWIEATELEPGPDHKPDAVRRMQSADAILVPGGFGERGVEGMILAAKYARENDVPYLGVCLGFQVAVIEYARSQVRCDSSFPLESAQVLISARVLAWLGGSQLDRV